MALDTTGLMLVMLRKDSYFPRNDSILSGSFQVPLEKDFQFSPVTQSCPTLCDPMDCSMQALPVHHQFLEFTQTHVGDAIQPSSSTVIPFSSCFQSFPPSGSFPMTQFFASGGQRIGASASVPPMNIQDWYPLFTWYFCSVYLNSYVTSVLS